MFADKGWKREKNGGKGGRKGKKRRRKTRKWFFLISCTDKFITWLVDWVWHSNKAWYNVYDDVEECNQDFWSYMWPLGDVVWWNSCVWSIMISCTDKFITWILDGLWL